MLVLSIIGIVIWFIVEKWRDHHTTPYSWARESKKWESDLYK